MKYKSYGEYYNPHLRFTDKIPKEWKVNKLKHILRNRNESNNPIKSKNILSLTAAKGVIPYSQKGDMGNKAKEDLSSYKLAYPNDIVMNSMNAVIGSINLSSYFGCVSPVYYMFYSDDNNINIKYYNYIFQTKTFQRSLEGLGNGILDIRMRIPLDKFNQVLLPIPDISTQNAIVNYLDEEIGRLNILIEKNNILINLLEEKRVALINQIVTKGFNPDVMMKDSGVEWIGEMPEHWNITKIRFLGSLQNGISKSSEYFGHGYPFISYGDVYNNDEIPNKINGKSDTTISERVAYSVQKNDIFFTRTSETIDEVGITSLCTRTVENGTFSGFLIRFRLFKNIDINVKFLKFYLQSIAIRHYFAKMMVIVTRASLGQNLLNNLNVLLPPIDEQNQIANYLDKETSIIDKTISKIQENIALLEEYKTSLIHHVVTGKIDVRGEEI